MVKHCKSCTECQHIKKGCVFANPDDAACIRCTELKLVCYKKTSNQGARSSSSPARQAVKKARSSPNGEERLPQRHHHTLRRRTRTRRRRRSRSTITLKTKMDSSVHHPNHPNHIRTHPSRSCQTCHYRVLVHKTLKALKYPLARVDRPLIIP